MLSLILATDVLDFSGNLSLCLTLSNIQAVYFFPQSFFVSCLLTPSISPACLSVPSPPHSVLSLSLPLNHHLMFLNLFHSFSPFSPLCFPPTHGHTLSHTWREGGWCVFFGWNVRYCVREETLNKHLHSMVTIESFVLKCGEKWWCFKGHFQLSSDVDTTWELSNWFVHSKMIILSSFTHPQVVANLYDEHFSTDAGQTCPCYYSARTFKLWKRTQSTLSITKVVHRVWLTCYIICVKIWTFLS